MNSLMGNRFSEKLAWLANSQSGWVATLRKIFYHPMFLASVGVHALLLLIPLGASEQQTKKPEPPKKEEAVKLAKIAAVKPTAANKPAVKRTAARTTQTPRRVRRTIVRASTPAPPLVIKTPENKKKIESKPKDEPKSKDDPKEKKDKSKVDKRRTDDEQNNQNTNNNDTNDSNRNNTANTGGGGSGEALAKENQQIAATLTNLRDTFAIEDADKEFLDEAQKDPKARAAFFSDDTVDYFYPSYSKDGDAEKVTKGILAIEYMSRTKPADVVTKLAEVYQSPEYELATTPIGEYGGGEVYELKQGSTVRYLNVVPAAGFGSSVVVFWEKSPI